MGSAPGVVGVGLFVGRLVRFAGLAFLVASSSCAASKEKVAGPEGAPPTAPRESVSKLALCSSTYPQARSVLGEPYRDGRLHGLRVCAWKVDVGGGRSEPVVVAFRDDLAVDLCFDLPGMATCDLGDRCPPAH